MAARRARGGAPLRYEVTVGERTVRVEVAPGGAVLVDDQAVAADTVSLSRDAWTIRVGSAVHEVRLLGWDPLRLWVDGDEVPASVVDQRALVARASGARAGSGRHEMRAPMPGLLKRVHVAEGDAVAQGAPLVTLEAMKMENELRAPAAGRVTRVAVAAGSKVEGGALLVIIAG